MTELAVDEPAHPLVALPEARTGAPPRGGVGRGGALRRPAG
jgi:hypothetical protein